MSAWTPMPPMLREKLGLSPIPAPYKSPRSHIGSVVASVAMLVTGLVCFFLHVYPRALLILPPCCMLLNDLLSWHSDLLQYRINIIREETSALHTFNAFAAGVHRGQHGDMKVHKEERPN